MSELESKVVAIIVNRLGIDAAQVTMEASFAADLNADSLDLSDLLMEFEKEFNISIPDEDAQKISTVGDAVAYIEKAIA
ncbi:MAG: acyl carrier protein [Paludibacteraceae bacterium]|nr:acyl carrier protein [Paludibacteraceae bacterium]